MPDDQATATAAPSGPPAEARPPEPQERAHYSDPRLIPGGAQGSTHEIGMSAVDPDDVPVADETP